MSLIFWRQTRDVSPENARPVAVTEDTPLPVQPMQTDENDPLRITGAVDIQDHIYSNIATGELAGSATAAQFPNQPCRGVFLKAQYGNAGRVYIGGPGVTVAAGTTDITSGYELRAGDEVYLPIQNLNMLYRITDNAGDDLTYLALVS